MSSPNAIDTPKKFPLGETGMTIGVIDKRRGGA